MATETKYRTIWRRFWAHLLDLLFLSWLFGLQWKVLDANTSPITKALLYTAASLIAPAYTVGMHWRFGATLGEQAVGLRVVDLSEKPIRFRQALARSAIELFSSIYSKALVVSMILGGQTITWETLAALNTGTIADWAQKALSALELPVILLNAKHRAIGDFIAGTVIVREIKPLRSTAQPAVAL